ncbi:MAG TPA: DUF882 domain-containing protein [Xanthobacteraceae bacterium]|nr:DUF882 domain-containing protein [Xanthobacteraceae bacterium]
MKLHVPVSIARRVRSLFVAGRGGLWIALAAGAALFFGNNLHGASAQGDTRTITLHHVHTDEELTITYKRDGRYDPEALKKIDWLLRDWRRNQAIHMDTELIDLLWEVRREAGAEGPIYVICGYRSPQTNDMLRRTSDGVAENSEHILGKAIDFYIPGVPLKTLFEIGLRLQDGGIGFYPTSGSPFVHLDVGHVRHWPTVSRQELVHVFPNGRTVHIPSDGQPLPGYALALADVEARGKEPSQPSLNAARMAGLIGRDREGKSPGTLLARLLGTDKREAAPDIMTTASVAPAPQGVLVPLPRRQPSAMKLAAMSAQSEPVQAIKFVPGAVTSAPLPWRDASPEEHEAGERALAYAPEPQREPPPMAPQRRIATVSRAAAIPQATSIVLKQPPGQPALVQSRREIQLNVPFTDPWLRAAILAPDLQHHMTAALTGAPDYRGLTEFMHEPVSALAMTFSAEGHSVVAADRFSGSAVVFLATASFVETQTASLQ